MLTAGQRDQQRAIRAALGVPDAFDVAHEVTRRVAFLADALRSAGAQALVLGVSGGVDSLLAGCLAQRAAAQCREQGGVARFVALRLPYGEQHDADDAQACLQVMRPDDTLTIDVQPGSDAVLASVQAAGQTFRDAGQQDFLHGNIKARVRMVAQYAVAGARQGLVVGTDQAAEALMGFFTKFGDGAADLMPLAGLTKRRVRAMASVLGAPDHLVNKTPTADLESLHPLQPDEVALGVTYDDIDDFLEGHEVSAQACETILAAWRRSAHKRSLPAEPV